MPNARLRPVDSGALSAYLGARATVIVFSVIVLIAAGALLLDTEDPAHLTITLGVSAFDSTRSGAALASLADFLRERGAGDVRLRFLGEGEPLRGCDCYLVTAVQASRLIQGGRFDCLSIAKSREGKRYGRGAVIVRAGADTLRSGARILFTSPHSAQGYISPARALSKLGAAAISHETDFAGYYSEEERVVFGVVYGAYDAGGVPLERLRDLERAGVIREGEVSVIATGEGLPEYAIAYEQSIDPRKLRTLRRRLPALSGKFPPVLEAQLLAIGIGGFVEPREADIALIKKLHAMTPRGSSRAGGEARR